MPLPVSPGGTLVARHDLYGTILLAYFIWHDLCDTIHVALFIWLYFMPLFKELYVKDRLLVELDERPGERRVERHRHLRFVFEFYCRVLFWSEFFLSCMADFCFGASFVLAQPE